MSAPLSRAEQIDWLRLARTDGVGPATFRALIERYGSAQRALEAVPGLARAGGRKQALRLLPRDEAERELVAAEACGAQLLALSEPGFPKLLAALDPPPPLIYLRGHRSVLTRPCVAIVGARNCSAAGRRIAEDLARQLGEAGFAVVSGLARGIDTAAHQGALATGTAAVLAGGPDVIYPPENRALYDSIVSAGAVVSEMPPGLAPIASSFPRRNRIISGLCRGVVIVEAALASGSLITARFALEQGREVFAVPGSPLDPRNRGSNDLLRQGAILTEQASDVIAALSDLSRIRLNEPGQERSVTASAAPDEQTVAQARRSLAALLGPTPVEVDELVRQSGLPAAAVLTVLLELELGGRLQRSPGHRVALI